MRSNDGKWGAFDAMVAGVPDTSAPSLSPPPSTAPVESEPTPAASTATDGGDSWGNFGEAPPSAVAAPPISTPAPAAPVNVSGGDSWGNFGEAPPSAVAAPPVSTPVMKASEANNESIMSTGAPVSLPVAGPLNETPVSTQAVAGSENDAWGDFDSSTPNTHVPTSTSNTTMGAGTGSDDSSWGTFNHAPSQGTVAASTPQESQGNHNDWGGFNASTPMPSDTPVSTTVQGNQSVNSGYNMPTPSAAAYAGGHTPYAPSPYYQNTPVGTPMAYTNQSAPPVAFYNQNDKNSLYHQLKSAEKAREDQARKQREEELKRKEEMLKKQEEDKKRGMFKELAW